MASLSRSKDGLFGVLMLVGSLALVAQSLAYHDESAHFPRFLAYSLTGLSLLHLTLWWRRGKTVKAEAVLPANGDTATAPLLSPWTRQCVEILLVLSAYLVGIAYLGYYSATTLFLAASMFWFSRVEACTTQKAGQGWFPTGRPLSILVAIGVFLLLTWLLFTRFLGTRMPEGLLF